ncbi:hypothetical protein LQZ18_04065 [Lachnospiraceae bacterium ZAX-1]
MSATELRTRLEGKIQNIRLDQTETIAPQMENRQEILYTPIRREYAVLTNNAIDLIKENLKRQPLSRQLFDTIKSPSGGSIAFTVPGLAGDEIEKELMGIILDYAAPRAYWDTPDPVEGTLPTCFSPDSLISNDGKPCQQCQFNTFGSKGGDSNAKACKESIELFLLRPDTIMPVVVRIPVSSKLLFQRYATRLISQMVPIYGTLTKITLEKATNRTGQPYAKYRFESVGRLSPEDIGNVKMFGLKFKEIMDAAIQQDVA